MSIKKPDGKAIQVAVVVPCYKVKEHICNVLSTIGPEVQKIYVVDDACPHNSGDYVRKNCSDHRVVVLRHKKNKGVGGAVLTGYHAALADHCEVIIKMDGDGQMDGGFIPYLIDPILAGEADYTKGNRFFRPEDVYTMPTIRLIANAILSLAAKVSSGYWHMFDVNNGFTAIHAKVARVLPFAKIAHSYFLKTIYSFGSIYYVLLWLMYLWCLTTVKRLAI